MENSLKELGQGLVEYALVLILISVAIVVSMQILGPTIGNVYSGIDEGLSYFSKSGGVVVADCEFRRHNDHYDWQCGTKNESGYEHGRYNCGDLGDLDPALKEQLELACST